MSLVKAGDLAEWAAALDPDILIAIGDEEDYEDDDTNCHVRTISQIAHQEWLYLWDGEHMGFILKTPTIPHPCEDFDWAGTPCWRLDI